MTTNHFTTSDNKKFWEGNQAVYQAAENAEPLIFLTREFIGRKILDAGGGDGSLMHALKNSLPGVEVLGVDLAPKHPDVEQGDLTDLRYEDASFDTIFCLEVIEHVSPEVTSKIFAELHRVMKPGGMFILTTPYAEILEESQVTCPTCERSFHRWGHQQRFLEEDFDAIAQAANFQPLTIMPVRYKRVKRLRFLGARFLRSHFMQGRMRNAKGRRCLLMIASKAMHAAVGDERIHGRRAVNRLQPGHMRIGQKI